MPKIIPKPKDEYKRKLIANINHYFDLADLSLEEQRIICRCSPSTYASRRKDPGKFTLDELLRISAKLKMSIDELVRVQG